MRALIESNKVVGFVLGDAAEGVEVPQGQTVQPGWTYTGGTFAPPIPSLDDARTLVLAELEAGCAATILEGFVSSALGAAYSYPSKASDQSNLQASVLASLFPGLAEAWTTPFWCQDAAGNWAYRPHTAAQIQRVGIDGKDAINACIAHKIQLEQQLAKAETLAEVEAITWTAPQ